MDDLDKRDLLHIAACEEEMRVALDAYRARIKELRADIKRTRNRMRIRKWRKATK